MAMEVRGFSLEPRLPQQGGEPGAAGMAERGESQLYDGAVFSGQEHHVGHCADGGQIGVLPQEGGPLFRLPQRQHQLEGHPHAGQGLEGIGAVPPPGVHHRQGGGQLLLALVVVGNDQIHPQLRGMAGLLHRGDPAVHGNDQGDRLGVEGVYGSAAQSVSLLHPVGI